MFPLLIIHSQAVYHMELSFYDQEKKILENHWNLRWRLRQKMFDVRFLLVIDRSAFGVQVK